MGEAVVGVDEGLIDGVGVGAGVGSEVRPSSSKSGQGVVKLPSYLLRAFNTFVLVFFVCTTSVVPSMRTDSSTSILSVITVRMVTSPS